MPDQHHDTADHDTADHDHDTHDHTEPGRSHGGGHLGAIRELFGGHHHHAGRPVDTALTSSREGIKAVKLSFVALGVTAVAQLVVALLTGSVALLNDTLHNFADAGTALPLWLAFVIGRRATTRRFTYGYGRAEDLAGLVVVVMIAASAVLAAWQAVARLLDPVAIHHLWAVAAAGVIGFAGNELVARYRLRVGRRIGSAALVADGLHARTDGLTSLGVVLGAIGVAAGYPAADGLVGLAIAVVIARVLVEAARDVFLRLMDGVDPDLVEQATRAVAGVAGVRDVGQLRIRWIGHQLHAEVCATVDAGLPLAEAHAIAEESRHTLLHEVPHLTSALIHADPDGDGFHTGVAHHTDPLAAATTER